MIDIECRTFGADNY